MRAQGLLLSQKSEFYRFEMPKDEQSLGRMDLQLGRDKSFGEPYSHPLKPSITPSPPLVMERSEMPQSRI